jgi:ATP-dependent exoDNAse (exonuclease V), alpha subunit - helicase superfamily I member
MDNLTIDQKKAYECMLKGNNVFISGEAGTGKAYVVSRFINEMSQKHKNILVCAPTGVAALNVGGVTIHRCFHISSEPQIKTYVTSVSDEVKEADIIIVDEISMCRVDLFDCMIRHIAKAERETFKRKQIIVVGDFFQLPPVTTKEDLKILKEFYKDYDKGFAFESEYWDDLNFDKIVLKEILRQSDNEFIFQLNNARIGNTSCIPYFNIHAKREKIEDGIILCARNITAQQINEEELDKINSESKFYESIIEGEVKSSDKPTFDILELKVGARVIILVNDIENNDYQNGTIGTIAALKANGVSVTLDNGKIIKIGMHEWEIESYTIVEESRDEVKFNKLEKTKIGSFKQLPLKLAYAITIHKSQGQTYDRVNLIPYSFSCGQLYVALSRVKSIEGLCLIENMKKEYLKCDEKVKLFYGIIDISEKKRRKDILAQFGKDVLLMDKGIKRQFPLELKQLMEKVYKEIQNE